MNPYLYISLFRRQRLNALTSAVGFTTTGGRLGVTIFVDAFSENVERDGGIFESVECAARALQSLGSATYTDAFDLFRNRMTDDGATFENPCFNNLMYTISQ
jgi:hypothetical protein